MPAAIPMLMFVGRAEEAMAFYAATFSNCRIIELHKHPPGPDGVCRAVQRGRLSLEGMELLFMDSPDVHAFTFTPSISFMITCPSVETIATLVTALSSGGQVFMPLDRYPFAERFAWVSDRFGVSWQLICGATPVDTAPQASTTT